MSDPKDPLDLELLALVDGRLDPERARAVEARAAADPALAARLRAYRAQDAALHAAFDPVLAEPVPPRLRVRPRAPALGRVAAAAVWIAVGAAAGSLGTRALLAGRPGAERGSPLAAVARQAVVAHVAFAPDARRPVELAAEQEQALVAWLSKRLGRPIHAPSLGARGLTLVGGRLLPGDLDAPAAQLMYESATGERVTLFVRALPRREAPTGFALAEERGVTTFYWGDGDWGYALSGALPRGELVAVATEVHAQLAGAPR